MMYTYILGIIILLFNFVNSKNHTIVTVNNKKVNKSKSKNKENYYLIFVNNTFEELQIYSDLSIQKRRILKYLLNL